MVIEIDSQELNDLSEKLTDIIWEAEANLDLIQACNKFKEIMDEEKLKNTLKEHLTNIINKAKSIIDSL